MIDQLAIELEKTTDLTKTFISEIRSSTTDFATVKNELKTLGNNLSDITRLVRDGSGDLSLVTKVAILERKLDELKEELEAYKIKNKEIIIHYTEEQELLEHEKSKSKIEVAKIVVGIILIICILIGVGFVV